MALPTLPQRELPHAGIEDILKLLQQQHRQKVDIVVPTSTLHLTGGSLAVAGIEPYVDEDGVTELSGLYRPTSKVDSDLAYLLDIPLKYVRRLRTEHVGLLDTNVNEWASRAPASGPGSKVLVRLFYGTDAEHPGTNGIARSIMSNSYAIRDNYDTALAALDGMRAAGLGATNIIDASLSENDNLYLYVEAPEVNVLAPKLLEGYRNPFEGRRGPHGAFDGDPVVHAGFVVTNSETGGGALNVTPRIIVRICRNGLTIKKDALRKVHAGPRMDEGQVVWKQDTVNTANELVKLQMRDAVTAFLTEDYLTSAVAKLTENADAPVEDAQETIQQVAKQLAFTEDEASDILNCFIRGGQTTAGGVMAAVTAAAQDIADVDRAAYVEATGVDAMLVAAGVRR